MERYAMQKLVQWKQRKNRKPLILKGARQVGKTWLMQEFGKQYFKMYLSKIITLKEFLWQSILKRASKLFRGKR